MAQAYLGGTALNQIWLGNTQVNDVGLRNQQFTTSNLYAYYDFNNPACYPGSGSIIFDLSGNGNDLTISGSVTYNSSGNISYFTWNTSSLGRLFRPAASSSAFIGTGVTVTSLFKAQSNRSILQERGIVNIALGNNEIVEQYIFDLDLATKRSAYYFGSEGLSSTTEAYSSSVKDNVDEWVVLSNTYSNGSVTPKFYVDNAEVTNTQVLNTFSDMLSGSFTIDVGVSQQIYNNDSYYWWGDISVVAVYNTALTEKQIIDNYWFLNNNYLL